MVEYWNIGKGTHHGGGNKTRIIIPQVICKVSVKPGQLNVVPDLADERWMPVGGFKLGVRDKIRLDRTLIVQLLGNLMLRS